MRHLYQQHNDNAFVAAIDPRIRLLAAGLLLALVVSSSAAVFPWLAAGVCLPAALFAGMRLRVLLLRLPYIAELIHQLKNNDHLSFKRLPLTVGEARREILETFSHRPV